MALKSLGRRLHEEIERSGYPRGADRSQCLSDPEDTSTERVEITPPSVELSFDTEANGYTWMELLPKLEFSTFQIAFIRGVDAAQEVHTLKRVAELAKEWNEPVAAIQIDLKRPSTESVTRLSQTR